MVKNDDSLFAYALLKEYQRNVRIKKRYIHEKISSYKSYPATLDHLKAIREKGILAGPRLWINSGFTVSLIKNSSKSSIELFEKYRQIPEITYVIGLMGIYSILAFQKGASILKYALSVTPSYPAQKSITDIELCEKGEIKRDTYPSNWDDLDWKIFNKMRDPTRSFGKVGGELGVTWNTVRFHFNRVLRDCKVWVNFFPLGYGSYPKALLTFKTKYEENLKTELEKIDRTSFLYKFNETIILYLHYDSYEDLRTFEILKKERKIKNLTLSRPIAWKDNF